MGRLHEILMLDGDDRARLEEMMHKGVFSSNQFRRAEILLLSDDTQSVKQIAQQVGRCEGTVRNIRNKYIEGGLDHALYDAPRPGAPKKILDRHEALITAIACSEVPEGRSQWTLQMIGDKLIELSDIDMIDLSTIQRTLKKTN